MWRGALSCGRCARFRFDLSLPHVPEGIWQFLCTAGLGGEANLTWTRDEPKRFQSSNHVKRGFCPQCGTPLTYEAPDGIALSIGAFDAPEEIEPIVQWGVEVKLPYVDSLAELPGYETERDPESIEFVRTMVSYQHPDHDTEN